MWCSGLQATTWSILPVKPGQLQQEPLVLNPTAKESCDDPPPSGAAKDSGPSSNDRAPDEVPAKGEFVLVVYHAWIEYLAMLC